MRLVLPDDPVRVVDTGEFSFDRMREAIVHHSLDASKADRPNRDGTMLLQGMSTFEVKVAEASPSCVVASLAGELDLTNARELEGRLVSAASPHALLALDVNAVVFIDSAALHVFFKLARHRDPSTLVIVMEPNAAVSRTFDIVDMRSAVRIVASLGELDVSS
jgi:anti-anti-sigma factor